MCVCMRACMCVYVCACVHVYVYVQCIILYTLYVPCTHTQLGKHCQELLMAVAANCTTHQTEDMQVIESLLAVRLKTKLFSNQFVTCIRYVCVQWNLSNPDALCIVCASYSRCVL